MPGSERRWLMLPLLLEGRMASAFDVGEGPDVLAPRNHTDAPNRRSG